MTVDERTLTLLRAYADSLAGMLEAGKRLRMAIQITMPAEITDQIIEPMLEAELALIDACNAMHAAARIPE